MIYLIIVRVASNVVDKKKAKNSPVVVEQMQEMKMAIKVSFSVCYIILHSWRITNMRVKCSTDHFAYDLSLL